MVINLNIQVLVTKLNSAIKKLGTKHHCTSDLTSTKFNSNAKRITDYTDIFYYSYAYVTIIIWFKKFNNYHNIIFTYVLI